MIKLINKNNCNLICKYFLQEFGDKFKNVIKLFK